MFKRARNGTNAHRRARMRTNAHECARTRTNAHGSIYSPQAVRPFDSFDAAQDKSAQDRAGKLTTGGSIPRLCSGQALRPCSGQALRLCSLRVCLRHRSGSKRASGSKTGQTGLPTAGKLTAGGSTRLTASGSALVLGRLRIDFACRLPYSSELSRRPVNYVAWGLLDRL